MRDMTVMPPKQALFPNYIPWNRAVGVTTVGVTIVGTPQIFLDLEIETNTHHHLFCHIIFTTRWQVLSGS